MYYSHPCPACGKVFFTFNEDKYAAARRLYSGIKQHLMEYDEDHDEYDFDDGPEVDTDEVYHKMIELRVPTEGGYEL